jgi:hypothetical protein
MTREFSGPAVSVTTALWVRCALVGVAVCLVAVFVTAAVLNPYYADGEARKLETHRQLGLPECSFKNATGLPCPSCGMTTSFALLIHGDPVNSIRANWVGTLLACFGLLVVPWALVSAVRRRPLFIVEIDAALVIVLLVFLVLALTRWAIVVALAWGRSAS